MSTKLEEIPQNLTTADKFTGKKVVDREGIQYGKVKHIHINSETLTVSGVTIHEGFRKNYYLTNDYIDKFTKELESIEITDGLMHSKILSKSEIWGIGEKVILKMTKDQYKKLD